MKSVFLDTNLILDFLDSDRKIHDLAKQGLIKVLEDEYLVVISKDMLSTIFYIIKNKQAVLAFYQPNFQRIGHHALG